MKIGTLNLGHQVRRPRHVPVGLLDALTTLELDVLVLTEFVSTPAYAAALLRRWPHVIASEQVQYGSSRARFANQVAVASRWPMVAREGVSATPDVHAQTNFLSVSFHGVVVTGVRAPAYKRASDWYGYWNMLRERLDGDVVIGDLNVDPTRSRKRDRVLPEEWQLVTPPGVSYRSPKNGTESTIDHALVAPGIEVQGAEFRPEFFARWGVDHCPLVINVTTSSPTEAGWES